MAWNPHKPNSLILAVHAAFINFDQILLFGGDQFDPHNSEVGDFRHATCRFDCNTFQVSRIDSPPFDVFCSGHALTIGGQLVVAGGTSRFPIDGGLHHTHFPGLRDAAVFTLGTQGTPRWIKIAPMNEGLPAPLCDVGEDPQHNPCVTEDDVVKTGGRWYPTLLTLPNGNILAMSGHPGPGDKEHSNFIPEVFVPFPSAGGVWHRLGDLMKPADDQKFRTNDVWDLYPRLHVLPNGDVFSSTPTVARRTKSITIDQGSWQARFNDICAFDVPDDVYFHYRSTSVLLPLHHDQGYQARILLCGGEKAYILDLSPRMNGHPVQWKPTADRTLPATPMLPANPPRLNLNAVYLPTGEIFVSGGINGVDIPPDPQYFDSLAVKVPEIFNPDTDTWTHLPNEEATVVRNYHSVALLMPDGRVWTAGSDRDARQGIDMAELAIEVYEPWYYGNPNRPEILALPDRILTGTQFVLETTQARDIQRVAMVRCASSTHAFSPDQRYITLNFRRQSSTSLLVDAPPDGNVAPPGFYFYYTINREGLPSIGWRTSVSNAPETETEMMWMDLTDV